MRDQSISCLRGGIESKIKWNKRWKLGHLGMRTRGCKRRHGSAKPELPKLGWREGKPRREERERRRGEWRRPREWGGGLGGRRCKGCTLLDAIAWRESKREKIMNS